MTDFFSWFEIHLGRWFGTPVRVHGGFTLFLVLSLISAGLDEGHPVATRAGWLALLVLAVIVHELAHLGMAAGLGSEPEDVRLWPLGNMVAPLPTPASRSSETIWVAAAGPALSLILAITVLVGLRLANVAMVLSPFGNAEGTGAPILLETGKPAASFTLAWWLGWFGFLNWILFCANLIPALPMDGGRIFRAAIAGASGGTARESMLGPHTAQVSAVVLLIVGLVRLFDPHKEAGITLIFLAALLYLYVRQEARLLEDGGFFDEGVFGYDFSEGYTSLEGSAQKVRPYHESALKRWRRRRGEQRRQRRLAREAAEEQRMDEILSKLHLQGRSALTDEEQRFLVRVSAKYRNRTKARE